MKINAHDLDEGEAIEVDHTYDPAGEEFDFIDLHYVQPILLTATIQKEAHCLFIKGTVRTTVERTCSRCLAVAKQDVMYPLSLSIDYHDEAVVDITDDVRELLIFDHPMKFVCSENCKGLCPWCGKNKNLDACDCEARHRGGAFADLKKIVIKDNKDHT